MSAGMPEYYVCMPRFLSPGVYRVGGGVSVPRRDTTQGLAFPEYSDEAIAAQIEGDVELSITIGEDGVPRDLRLEKPLGYGLDERAIEYVGKWRFSPGAYDGRPVAVAALASVHFSLQRIGHLRSSPI
jgi:protein TonB